MSRVSTGLYDAWKIDPPCTYGDKECRAGCPYTEACHGPEEEEDEEDEDEDCED